MARPKTAPPRCALAEQLVALAEDLRVRSDLDEVDLRLGKAGAKATFKSLEKSVLVLPPALRSLYEAHDGLYLGWQEAGTRVPGSNVRFVYGQLHIVSMMDAYYRNWATRLGYEGDASRGWLYALTPNVRAIDLPELDQETRVVALEIPARAKKGKPPTPASRLWFVDTKGPSFPLALDAEGYLREALAFCGIEGWQKIFADFAGIPAHETRENDRRWIAREAGRVLADARRLFPDRVGDDRYDAMVRQLESEAA